MKCVNLISLFILVLSVGLFVVLGCASQMQAPQNGDSAASEVVSDSAENGQSEAQANAPVTNEQAVSAPEGKSDSPQAQNDKVAPPLPPSTHPLEASPAEAIYFIIVDRFFNAQDNGEVDLFDNAGWHGGDIEGIRQKLPWLESMGITKIWLSPIFLTAHEKFFGNGAFHGYWTYDLSKLDPYFGTEEDLKSLARDAKEHHIELILDFVVNHVGYGSPLVENNPTWFHPAQTIEDWNDPDQLVNRQVHGLPDLDQSNPAVYAYITNAAWKWLAMPNVAGFRLDAVKHVDISFWSRFNQELKSGKKDIMLIGEYFDGDPKKVDEIQKNGKFTQMFDFPLSFALRDVFCEHKSLAGLASIVTNDRQYSNANNMVTFIDNHDMPRFISLCHDDSDAMGRALRVMLSWRGIPSIYYGTEVPLSGEKEPDNRGDMDFNRADLYPLIQSALRMRATNPVFAKGATSTIHYQPGFVVFARELGEKQALIMINQTAEAKSYMLPAGKWRDAESRRMITAMANVRPNTVQILVNSHAVKPLIDASPRKITFRVPNDGNTYAITGSAPELGNWNPANAPKTTSELEIELPSQTVVTYKPVRVGADGSIAWADGDNRELFTDKADIVEVAW